MEFDIDKRDVECLMSYIRYLIKFHETDESYEVCKELLDFNSKLGKYILGYFTTEEIQGDLYAFCKIEGEIIDVNIFHCSTVFQISTGQKFYFCEIDLREMSNLLELYEEQETRKIANRKLQDEEDED